MADQLAIAIAISHSRTEVESEPRSSRFCGKQLTLVKHLWETHKIYIQYFCDLFGFKFGLIIANHLRRQLQEESRSCDALGMEVIGEIVCTIWYGIVSYIIWYDKVYESKWYEIWCVMIWYVMTGADLIYHKSYMAWKDDMLLLSLRYSWTWTWTWYNNI